MEESEPGKMENHLPSAAAFVEGGIQDACDDACSICLEAFCDSDPSTVTGCKHEFHLQCVLEWCQRSSQCPMCWQPISLKDPTSQELLEAVERERNIRINQPRNTTIFHHPTLGDFELQQLPVGVNDAELEERIIQHLAAAAAMGRTHHFSRRESHRTRSSAYGRPQYLVFSAHPNTSAIGPFPASTGHRGRVNESETAVNVGSSTNLSSDGDNSLQEIQHSMHNETEQALTSEPRSSTTLMPRASLPHNHVAVQSSTARQDRAGPSELQSFSESLKSKFYAVSTRYKETIARSTRGWKERLFSKNTSVADLGSEVRSELNAGIATVSHMMEHLDTRGSPRPSDAIGSHNLESTHVTNSVPLGPEGSFSEPDGPRTTENHDNNLVTDKSASIGSGSN